MTVQPAVLCQSVLSPNAILDNEPSVEFALGWNPGLVDFADFWRFGAANELRLICDATEYSLLPIAGVQLVSNIRAA